MNTFLLVGITVPFLVPVFCFLIAVQNSTSLVLSNDRLFAAVNKSTGAINDLTLDGQDLLGKLNYETPTPGGATGGGNRYIFSRANSWERIDQC